MPRILLLIPTRTYRTRAFMRATQRLKAEVVVGSERPQVLARSRPGTTAVIDFRHPESMAAQVVAGGGADGERSRRAGVTRRTGARRIAG